MNERPRKSRWTIRLRTLLLLMLTICCLMGWLAYERRQGARRQELAQNLNRADSNIELEYRDYWGRTIGEPPPDWQRRLLGDYYFQRITGAEINEPGLLPDKGRRLSELHDLRSLRLRGTTWGFTDHHAAALAPLRRLESVSLAGARLTDQGLAALSPENPLRALDLSGTLITDAGLAHLAQFQALESLDLSETLVTGEGMKQLARLPRLKHLTLRRVMVSTEGVRELARCPALESVSLAELPLWPEAFAGLAQAPRLRYVTVGDFHVFDDEALQAMREDRLIQEQAAFALGPPSVFWAIDIEEGTYMTPYLRWLLEHGADPNDRTQDASPLLWLVEKNALEPVHALLEYGVQVNQQDRQGRTALTLAAEQGQKDMVRLLLAGGADSNLGGGSLLPAAARGQVEIVRELIARGADVKRANRNGFTPLHSAAAGGHVEVVKILVQHGADPAAKNAGGDTAYSLAQRRLSTGQPGGAEMVSLLQTPPPSP